MVDILKTKGGMGKFPYKVDLKKILIVGGGTAGWITAVTLLDSINRNNLSIDVVLIESPDIPTIGVGEGTWPSFLETFLSIHDIKIDDINGTYKAGSHYLNWYKEEDSKYNNWYHPFVNDHIKDTKKEFEQFDFDKSFETFGEVNPDDYNTYFNMISNIKWAVHLDSNKLISVLKNKAIEYGCKYIQDTVIDCEINNENIITSVILSDNSKLESQLFIDCSGFKRTLISKMKPKFIDYSDQLICDRAISTHLNEKNTNKYYWTKLNALSSGWSWNIPLQNKTGTGYVYSSKFISDEDAKKEFNEYLDINEDYKILKFKPGVLETPWVNNCVAVGLSAGFFEPMEATNIHFLGTFLFFLQMVVNGEINIDIFNKTITRRYEDTKDYLFCHYKFSKRNNSDFWKYVRNNIELPISVEDKISKFKDIKDDKTNIASLFSNRSWLYLFLGYNWRLDD
tara:strand:- start:239 stop:1597 length:1359 start_codon:yes stop_codon:yes gene_type:complete